MLSFIGRSVLEKTKARGAVSAAAGGCRDDGL